MTMFYSTESSRSVSNLLFVVLGILDHHCDEFLRNLMICCRISLCKVGILQELEEVVNPFMGTFQCFIL